MKIKTVIKLNYMVTFGISSICPYVFSVTLGLLCLRWPHSNGCSEEAAANEGRWTKILLWDPGIRSHLRCQFRYLKLLTGIKQNLQKSHTFHQLKVRWDLTYGVSWIQLYSLSPLFHLYSGIWPIDQNFYQSRSCWLELSYMGIC